MRLLICSVAYPMLCTVASVRACRRNIRWRWIREMESLGQCRRLLHNKCRALINQYHQQWATRLDMEPLLLSMGNLHMANLIHLLRLILRHTLHSLISLTLMHQNDKVQKLKQLDSQSGGEGPAAKVEMGDTLPYREWGRNPVRLKLISRNMILSFLTLPCSGVMQSAWLVPNQIF